MSTVILSDKSVTVGICNKLKEAAEESELGSRLDHLSLYIALIPLTCESLGILPIQNILLSELFPTDIRNISVGFVRAVAYLAVYCNMMVYPMASGANIFFELMLIYGAMSAFMTVWAIITVKDTDSMSLVEIERSYKRPKGDYPPEKEPLPKSPKLLESAPLLKG